MPPQPRGTGFSLSPNELRDRGATWVAAQSALIALIVGAAWLPPGWGGARVVLAPLGVAASLLGALVVVWAWRSLGVAMTPFPRPRGGAKLAQDGPYAHVRHPMYAGALLFFGGFAIATTPAVLVPLAALAMLWSRKAALEESYLERRGDYGAYRERVRGRFVPRVATPPAG